MTTPIVSTTNKADGSITFEGLKAKGPGYSANMSSKKILETKVPEITFDENSYEVTAVMLKLRVEHLKLRLAPKHQL